MFKGLAGLKKVVKGGISVVAEHSSDLAEKVISDPNTSQGHLKENLKKKVSEVVSTGEQLTTDTHAKEKADEVTKVVNKVRHYGALGEDYLGYDDPTKDLRKAVKAKEKAAKKARKAKKKKTGKKEDLFDPENLAKFKAELEERKRREEEFAKEKAEFEEDSEAGEVVKSPEAELDNQPEQVGQDINNPLEFDIKFTLELEDKSTEQDKSESEVRNSPKLKSPLTPIRNTDTDDWKLFQSLTSGVDAVIKQKKEELQDIKLDSYFQQKTPVPGPSDETSKVEEGEEKEEEEEGDKTKEESEGSSESEEADIGLVDIPDTPEADSEEEEDIFNTAFVDAITSGEIKLAVIPDDPVYDDKDDPFNTAYAEVIVQKDKVEKRKEANRIKFSGLSSVADVLSGKSDKVDSSLIEHATKRKRRRANRINLIAEQETDVTAREQIGTFDLQKADQAERQPDILITDHNQDNSNLEVLVTSTPLPALQSGSVSNPLQLEQDKPTKADLDLSEFEVIGPDSEDKVALTSNVAILAGEFSKPIEEEEDDFDAAFDALAQESVTRGKLEDLERQFEDADVFDTTSADNVLNLASLTNKVEEIEEPLETFEDKDPFDTSAYEHITGDLETDLDFDSLAKRDPEKEEEKPDQEELKKASDDFSGWDEVKPIVDQGWAAFEETKTKPSRPPPPRPAPPRPQRPKLQHLDPTGGKGAPSVVIKAPSTESIKSWNCATADILIKKSENEALDEPLPEDSEEEDPFDTSNFESVVKELTKKEDIEEDENQDPFDISGFKSPEPQELQTDLLTTLNEDSEVDKEVGDLEAPCIVPSTAIEVDPFDTEFASSVLPDKGDPFNTSYVKGGPGKAEIKALEEEFLTQEEFDPRTDEVTEAPSGKVYPGVAGRARPKRSAKADLEIKAPEAAVDELEEDPFDTTIVDKVIPVRKAAKTSDVSVEDENFDPTSTFNSCREEVDPFDTTIAGQVIPELADKPEPELIPEQQSEPISSEEPAAPSHPDPEPEPEPEKEEPIAAAVPVKPKPVDEIARKIGRARPRKPLPRQLTDEDFDPRA